MSDYIGFGKQSQPGPLRRSTKFFPVVQSHEEMCELCQAIKPRSDMEWFDTDEDGTPLYRCMLSPRPPTRPPTKPLNTACRAKVNRSPRSQHTIHTGSPVPTRHHPAPSLTSRIEALIRLYADHDARTCKFCGPPTDRPRAEGLTAHAPGQRKGVIPLAQDQDPRDHPGAHQPHVAARHR